MLPALATGVSSVECSDDGLAGCVGSDLVVGLVVSTANHMSNESRAFGQRRVHWDHTLSTRSELTISGADFSTSGAGFEPCMTVKPVIPCMTASYAMRFLYGPKSPNPDMEQ